MPERRSGGGFNRLRVDTVGSLVKPPNLEDAFIRRAAGRLTPNELESVQDTTIRSVIHEQERHGLPIISDGEFRREAFMVSFGDVAGWDVWERAFGDLGLPPGSAADPARALHQVVQQPLRLLRNRPLAEYEFARGVATRPVKVTVLDTDRIRQIYDPQASAACYPTVASFMHDVVDIQRQIVGGLVAAGCGYVSIDAPSFTRFVDPGSLQDLRQRGEEPQQTLAEAIDNDNAVIAGFDDVTFGIHLCRGNSAAGPGRTGTYDAIAEQLFSGLKHQRFLLEYDDAQLHGDFAPLRYVPRDKTVVLGLISTKRVEIEQVDDVRRRIDEAARYIPLDQLALSPQCGFNHNRYDPAVVTFPGEDEQWRKVDIMLETAARVWGTR